MTNTFLKDLLTCMKCDSATCDYCTLSSYINLLEIMVHHYPRNKEVKEMKIQFLKQINDRLDEMYQGSGYND